MDGDAPRGSDGRSDDGLTSPWGAHALGGGEPLAVGIGPLDLRIRLRDDELWIAHDPGGEEREPREAGRELREVDVDEPAAGEDEWLRWPMAEPPDRVHLAPVLPPRTVVAEPEVPFRLLPDARVRVFVRVPAWVRIRAGGADGASLGEVPSVVLSDTWWGDLSEGELCYWLGTTARRKMTGEAFAPHRVVCPLVLVNRSRDELPVERIALRVGHLGVFSDDGRLWSDETRVRYRGVDEGSDIDVTGRPPPEAAGAVRVAEAREGRPAGGLRSRSIARLKSLPGLAGL